MAAAGYTHSQLAVMLIDGALAHVAGNVQGKMPFAPVPATELERAEAGLPQNGQTYFYALGQAGGVYIDMSGSVATVWFMDGDYDRALAATDAAMKQKYRVKQLGDEALPVPKQRRRNYEVDCGNSRVAHVVVEYSEHGAKPARFWVKIGAQIRRQ
ncbi:MAG: hypothetical protein A4S17_01015 [Proteobacteria bacterium HN_bin10]|jgi:hypothetical protein|nr:MAG: hypothetical protein A4S17_01015 [Proteobacteria bacterium HN_bin10]